MPGVPEALFPRLDAPGGSDPAGPAVIRGGPYHGVRVTAAEFDGVAHLVLNGSVTLPRWDPANPVSSVVGLPTPAAEVPPETERAYREQLSRVLAADGAPVRPEVPTGPWVGWLTGQQSVLFHGSPDGDIDRLLPRRTSYELNDEAGRGNRRAVYATDDAWWVMWFAVVDRERLRMDASAPHLVALVQNAHQDLLDG